MRYIRTKDGRIIDTTKVATGSKYMDFATNDESFREIFKTEPLAKADTIEELFMPNDLLVVGDDKNQMPIFIESIEYLKAWLYCHDIYKIKEFYIKNGNDFKCVAKANDKGELELWD